MSVMLADDWCGEDEQEAVSRFPLWSRERAEMRFPEEDHDRYNDADETLRVVEIL